MPYPNAAFWSALDDGRRVPVGDGKHYVLSVIDCGSLVLPTGRLTMCDPIVGLETGSLFFVQVPPGRYRVRITLADVSDANDGSYLGVAYATLMLDETAIEVTRRIITPIADGPCPPELDAEGKFFGFPVDAGLACFMDQGVVDALMPETGWFNDQLSDWFFDLWSERLDNPGHIRSGIANIPIPDATNGETIVIFSSGWGDGYYPIVGGFDASDRLVRVHIDFFVVFEDEQPSSE